MLSTKYVDKRYEKCPVPDPAKNVPRTKASRQSLCQQSSPYDTPLPLKNAPWMTVSFAHLRTEKELTVVAQQKYNTAYSRPG